MEILQLQYFLDVAETEHVTRSAERLNVAQPAITQAIRRLERELEVELFARRGRNVVLTEFGRHLRDRLLPIAADFAKIPGELRTMARLANATVHLNVLAASSLVADAIVKYVRENASVNFSMTQIERGGIYDIGISTGMPGTVGEAGYVRKERIFLAAPAAGRYAGCTSVRLSELSEEGFISLSGSRALRRICDAYCLKAGFTPRLVFESDNPGAVRSMIAANLGVGFWPEFTWGAIDTDRVRLIKVEEPEMSRDIAIERRDNKADGSEVARFYAFLTGYFEARGAEA